MMDISSKIGFMCVFVCFFAGVFFERGGFLLIVFLDRKNIQFVSCFILLKNVWTLLHIYFFSSHQCSNCFIICISLRLFSLHFCCF